MEENNKILMLSKKDMDNMIRRINRRLKTFERNDLQAADMYKRIMKYIKTGGYKFRKTSTGFEIIRSVENYNKPANMLKEADDIGGLQTWINRRKEKFEETRAQALDKIKVEVIVKEFVDQFIDVMGGSPLEKDNVNGRPQYNDAGEVIEGYDNEGNEIEATEETKKLDEDYQNVDRFIDMLNGKNGEDIHKMSYAEIQQVIDRVENILERIAPDFEEPW